MNIEQLLEELRKTLQVNGVSHTILLHLLERCRIALSEQADLLRRAEMSVENCDMYREREASVPDALRATPVAQDEVSRLREREAFNSGYDAICRRSITNREIASRMFQAGAEWQRSQQSAPAGWPTDDMVVRGAEELHDSLRMFGIDINFDTETTGTEIQQEIVEAVFNAMLTAAPKADVQEPVAYLDIGIGGYVDIGSDKPIEELGKLPMGRHMLAIIGTYGIDGYTAAPQPASDDARDALVDALEQITRMTYDEWTNGAVANRIAEEALVAYRAAQEKK